MTDCILWAGRVLPNGYASSTYTTSDGVEHRSTVHRIAWIKAHGPPPRWTQVHHKCGNKLCVNLDHLEALPVKEHRALHPLPRDERGRYIRCDARPSTGGAS